jgi:conjugal transfer/entry exclusion protein
MPDVIGTIEGIVDRGTPIQQLSQMLQSVQTRQKIRDLQNQVAQFETQLNQYKCVSSDEITPLQVEFFEKQNNMMKKLLSVFDEHIGAELP